MANSYLAQTPQRLARNVQGSTDGVKALEDLVHIPQITETLIGVAESLICSGVREGDMLRHIPLEYRSAVQVGLRGYAPSL